MTDFSTLLRTLGDQGGAYILVGDAAATVHGSARLTLASTWSTSAPPTTWRGP